MDSPPTCLQVSSSSESSDSDYEPHFKRQKSSLTRTQVCIVCFSATSKYQGYDIVVTDLDSLRNAAASMTDDEFIPIRAALRLKLDMKSHDISFGFCGLGSKLYVFESTPAKSVYTIDLSSYSYDLTKPTVEFMKNELPKARDMCHAKYIPYATPTPDGKKILVLSSLIIFRPSPYITAPYTTAGDNDFELYDPHANTWQKLPGIRHDWRNYYCQRSRSDFIRILAFTFIDTSTFFLQTTTGLIFSLDLESIDKGWKKRDTFFGADSVPHNNGRFLVIEEQLCVTPWMAYDIKKEQRFPHRFSFPLTSFADDIRPSGGPSFVTVLDDDAKNGKYNFCNLQSGKSRRTGYPHLIINLYSCDLTKYKEDKEEDEDFAELSTSMSIGESFKFFLDGEPFKFFFEDDEECDEFFPLNLFSISAGTN